MNEALKEILLRKKHTSTESQIDWDDRRDKYLEAVEKLYEQIYSAFREAIEDKSVSIHRRSKLITESYIGAYSVDDLVLIIGDEQVRFSPCGRNIAGAAGRVDVVGEQAEARLIYQPESGWAIVQTRQPALKTVPLGESTLAEVLEQVMRDR